MVLELARLTALPGSRLLVERSHSRRHITSCLRRLSSGMGGLPVGLGAQGGDRRTPPCGCLRGCPPATLGCHRGSIVLWPAGGSASGEGTRSDAVRRRVRPGGRQAQTQAKAANTTPSTCARIPAYPFVKRDGRGRVVGGGSQLALDKTSHGRSAVRFPTAGFGVPMRASAGSSPAKARRGSPFSIALALYVREGVECRKTVPERLPQGKRVGAI
jgi:hypothetical protein